MADTLGRSTGQRVDSTRPGALPLQAQKARGPIFGPETYVLVGHQFQRTYVNGARWPLGSTTINLLKDGDYIRRANMSS